VGEAKRVITPLALCSPASFSPHACSCLLPTHPAARAGVCGGRAAHAARASCSAQQPAHPAVREGASSKLQALGSPAPIGIWPSQPGNAFAPVPLVPTGACPAGSAPGDRSRRPWRPSLAPPVCHCCLSACCAGYFTPDRSARARSQEGQRHSRSIPAIPLPIQAVTRMSPLRATGDSTSSPLGVVSSRAPPGHSSLPRHSRHRPRQASRPLGKPPHKISDTHIMPETSSVAIDRHITTVSLLSLPSLHTLPFAPCLAQRH